MGFAKWSREQASSGGVRFTIHEENAFPRIVDIDKFMVPSGFVKSGVHGVDLFVCLGIRDSHFTG
jgi:hypothetical protein